MSARGELSAATYAREIERRWSRLVERQGVLSPREWFLVSNWYARGIPLQIVEEAMEALVERGRRGRGRAPRSLSRAARPVEEAWTAVLEGRLADEASGPRAGGDPAPGGGWRRALEREAEGSALRRTLGGLLRRLDQGEPPERLDAELDRTLADSADQELCRAVRDEIDLELAAFRARMSGERFDETRRRALVDRLRQRLKLPRLATGQP